MPNLRYMLIPDKTDPKLTQAVILFHSEGDREFMYELRKLFEIKGEGFRVSGKMEIECLNDGTIPNAALHMYYAQHTDKDSGKIILQYEDPESPEECYLVHPLRIVRLDIRLDAEELNSILGNPSDRKKIRHISNAEIDSFIATNSYKGSPQLTLTDFFSAAQKGEVHLSRVAHYKGGWGFSLKISHRMPVELGADTPIFHQYSKANFLYNVGDNLHVQVPSGFVAYLFDYLKHLTVKEDSFENNYEGFNSGGARDRIEEFYKFMPKIPMASLGYYTRLFFDEKRVDLEEVKQTIKIGEKDYNLVELFDFIVKHFPELYLEALNIRTENETISTEIITDPESAYRHDEIRGRIIKRMERLNEILRKRDEKADPAHEDYAHTSPLAEGGGGVGAAMDEEREGAAAPAVFGGAGSGRMESTASPAAQTTTSAEESLVLKIREIRDKDPTRTSLNLIQKGIGPKGVSALAVVLREEPALTSLNLSFNLIGDEGAIALAEALRINKTMTSLILDFNEMGDVGREALANIKLCINRNNELAAEKSRTVGGAESSARYAGAGAAAFAEVESSDETREVGAPAKSTRVESAKLLAGKASTKILPPL